MSSNSVRPASGPANAATATASMLGVVRAPAVGGGSPVNSDDARTAMVDQLRSEGTLSTPAVVAALGTVPRHRFLDGVRDETAYADIAITVKTTAAGVPISSASQPTIVAMMLELAQLESGHRVLEIGTGTGYNAALLSSIVGPEGGVVTVELDEDLAVAARSRLTDLHFGHIEVVTGDGRLGYGRAAPYDRIVVTTGAPRIAEAWVEQLREGGRLVTPVVKPDGVGMVHCLVKRGTDLHDLTTIPCGFLPMRSQAAT